jgi:hypothetical protein
VTKRLNEIDALIITSGDEIIVYCGGIEIERHTAYNEKDAKSMIYNIEKELLACCQAGI